MKILQYWCAAVLSFLCVLVGRGQARAADEYVGSQFTDGTVFSEVVVKDHLVAIPFPNVHGPLAFGSIDSWLLRWKIDNLKTNQPNYPEHVIYLAHQKRTGQMAYGFRASASSFFVACNSSNTVELY